MDSTIFPKKTCVLQEYNGVYTSDNNEFSRIHEELTSFVTNPSAFLEDLLPDLQKHTPPDNEEMIFFKNQKSPTSS